jgi:UDP-N-acetylglucosamine 1-carboxyvinyltransferase
MIASLLTDETLVLENVPRLADVTLLQHILANHGVDITLSGKRAGEPDGNGQTLRLSAKNVVDTTAPYHLVSKMRASFWVIGPLVARMAKRASPCPAAAPSARGRWTSISMPARARRGNRDRGRLCHRPRQGRPARRAHHFDKVSVGATHTALMAASLAKGESVIENAAREPEIVDVADCLRKMGAKIEGAGTSTVHVEGVERLHGATHAVLPDRIETGTYAMAVAMTGGEVMLQGGRADLLQSALDVLTQAGATVSQTNEGIRVSRNGSALGPVDVSTAPFPGFPTDSAGAIDGAHVARRRHLAHHRDDLRKPLHACAGARAPRRENSARRRSGDHRRRRAPQGRAGDGDRPARLGVARDRGSCGGRRDRRHRVYHLDRGFERLEEKLSRCGADIERVAG